MCWQETVFAHEESYVFLNILVLLCGPFSISFLKPMGCQQNGKLLITGAYKSLVQYIGTYFSVLIIMISFLFFCFMIVFSPQICECLAIHSGISDWEMFSTKVKAFDDYKDRGCYCDLKYFAVISMIKRVFSEVKAKGT